VSDTQSPLWFEKLVLKSDDNEHATGQILDAIARDTTCVAVFHRGDITGASSDDEQWEKFDTKAEAIWRAAIPIFPAFGNHEYLFSGGEGKYNFSLRFPFVKKEWYRTNIGSVSVITLNSNFSHLSKDEVRSQQEWYERSLDSLDLDSTVAIVIAGCHHSPFTNSTIVDPSAEVRERFVAPFLKSKKGRIFLTGHSHAFEHFRIEGKDFLVIGGGGGLLHPLLQGVDARWHDRFVHNDRRSFFHYVRMYPLADRIEVEVLALAPQKGSYEKVYGFEVPYSEK
jgi:predicted phosphodiesterase